MFTTFSCVKPTSFPFILQLKLTHIILYHFNVALWPETLTLTPSRLMKRSLVGAKVTSSGLMVVEWGLGATCSCWGDHEKDIHTAYFITTSETI